MPDPDEPAEIPAPASAEVIFAAAQATGWSHHGGPVQGWLRPTVFGAVDGLVTNAALIAGVPKLGTIPASAWTPGYNTDRRPRDGHGLPN